MSWKRPGALDSFGVKAAEATIEPCDDPRDFGAETLFASMAVGQGRYGGRTRPSCPWSPTIRPQPGDADENAAASDPSRRSATGCGTAHSSVLALLGIT